MPKNASPAPGHPFPDDLAQAQRDLHRAQADHTANSRILPWSAEPHPGWPAEVHSVSGAVLSPAREASPGYTP
ncbi:hypothetical protein ACIQA2_34795, partial [Streptomyces sp. NPDC088557]